MTRTPIGDGFDGLSIGNGWRMWKTIICPQCHQAAPYVLSQQVEDVDHDDENEMTLERWTRLLECPRCSNQWIDVDEYWEDD